MNQSKYYPSRPHTIIYTLESQKHPIMYPSRMFKDFFHDDMHLKREHTKLNHIMSYKVERDDISIQSI